MIHFNRDQELTSKEAIWCCIGDKGKHENFVMFLVVAVWYCVYTGSYGVLLVVTTCYWLLLFGTVCYGLLPVVTVCSWLLLFLFFVFFCVTAFFWLLHITHNVSL